MDKNVQARKVWRGIGKFVLFAGVYIAAKILASSLLSGWISETGEGSKNHFLLMSLFSELIPIVAVLLLSRYVLKLTSKDLWMNHPGMGWKISHGFIVGTLLFCGFMAYMLFTRNMIYQGAGGLPISETLLFLPAYGVQSFEEELLSRGVLQRVIKDKWGLWPSILLPSLFFVLLHLVNGGLNFLAIVNIFLVGVLFALMVYATGSLWVAGAAHAAWNYMEGTIFGQMISGNEAGNSLLKFKPVGQNEAIMGGQFGPEGSVITVFILVTAALCYYLLWRKKLKVTGPQE